MKKTNKRMTERTNGNNDGTTFTNDTGGINEQTVCTTNRTTSVMYLLYLYSAHTWYE